MTFTAILPMSHGLRKILCFYAIGKLQLIVCKILKKTLTEVLRISNTLLPKNVFIKASKKEI